MALIGKNSKCALCGELIGSEPAAGLPHFVRNKRDPLYVLSDAAVHRRCLHASPLRERAQNRIDERRSRMRDRVCAVCGEVIGDDWYTTDHLTDDRGSPLYEFNYLHFHRSHLPLWPRLVEFRRLVDDFVETKAYDGPPILPPDL
jgi:DNA-directed RNA polymerase subunit N (RpoN/RPB10)